jgi:hypothetical protein
MSPLTRSRADLRLAGILGVTLGLALLVLDVSVFRFHRSTLEGDTRDVSGLQRQLDSVRALHRGTSDAAVRGRLEDEIRTREVGVSRRAYHIPGRAETVRRWWTPGGPGVLWAGAGAALLALGVIALRSARRAGSGGTDAPRRDGS